MVPVACRVYTLFTFFFFFAFLDTCGVHAFWTFSLCCIYGLRKGIRGINSTIRARWAGGVTTNSRLTTTTTTTVTRHTDYYAIVCKCHAATVSVLSLAVSISAFSTSWGLGVQQRDRRLERTVEMSVSSQRVAQSLAVRWSTIYRRRAPGAAR